MGRILGHGQKGDAMATAFEAGLAAGSAPACGPAPTIIVYGQNGVTMGAGTLANSVIEAAGFRNLAAELGFSGMTPFPLELLVQNRPDAIILSNPVATTPALADQISTHPAIRALEGSRRGYFVPDAAWSCGGPFTLEALNALRRLRAEISPCNGKQGDGSPQ
jgi:iron complex transport system substrate-binding protein